MRAADALAERRLRDLGREVDGLRLVERVVDLAAREVRVDQVRAGLRLLRPEGRRVPEPGQHDLAAVRQVREELLRRALRRRREVELPADEEGLDVRRAHRAVVVLVRRRRPGVDQPAAAPEERRRRVAQVRFGLQAAGGEGVGRRLGVEPRGGGHLPPDERLGEREIGEERLEPETARVAVGGREPRAQRHRSGDRRRSPRSTP